VHLTADIYVYTYKGEMVLPGRGGGACLCVSFVFVPRVRSPVAHVWSDGAYKHSLYLVLYKLSVSLVDWKFDELSCSHISDFVHFFLHLVHVCALHQELGYLEPKYLEF
jgi:hypothetical protein